MLGAHMTADLVAFLRARLDEDEQVAQAVEAGPWHVDGGSVYAGYPTEQVVDYSEAAEHIARHDPARVLADVEATREVLRLTKRAFDYRETFLSGFATAMEGALRLFAVAYAEHPDYREEWRP